MIGGAVAIIIVADCAYSVPLQYRPRSPWPTIGSSGDPFLVAADDSQQKMASHRHPLTKYDAPPKDYGSYSTTISELLLK